MTSDRISSKSPLHKGRPGEVRDELEFHLSMLTDEYLAQGLTRTQAEARARSRLGDLDRVVEQCERIAVSRERRSRVTGWMSELRDDLLFAARQFRRQPAAGLTTAGILALGIGAVVAVFSVVYSVLLDPIPLEDSQLVHFVQLESANDATPNRLISPREFGEIEVGSSLSPNEPVNDAGAFLESGMTWLRVEGPQRISAMSVSSGFFDTVKIGTELGQLSDPGDYRRGAAKTAIVSSSFWRGALGADPEIVGRTLNLNGELHLVRGVMAEGLDRVVPEIDVFLPMITDEQFYSHKAAYLQVLVRVAPDATRTEANTALSSALATYNSTLPENERAAVILAPLRGLLVGDFDRRLLLLFGAVGLVLLVACANAANLLLAQGLDRRQELSVRSALGAGRARILRQLLTESGFVASLATIASLIVAGGLLRVLLTTSPDLVPGLERASLSGPVLLFAIAIAALVTLTVGLLPAIRSQRAATLHLRSGGKAVMGSTWLRRSLVSAQVAVTLVLLAAAGLLIQSAVEETRVPPGFDTERLMSAQISLPRADYPDRDSVTRTFERLMEESRSLPGVVSVGASNRVPLSGSSLGLEFVSPGTEGPVIGGGFRLVSADYFKTMGVEILSGREFNQEDHRDAPPSVVVNQTFARTFWGSDDVIDREISSLNTDFQDDATEPLRYRVIGVVADVRDYGLATEPVPEVYMVLDQVPPGPWSWIGNTLLLVLRSEGPPEGLIAPLRDRIQAIDSALPISNIATLEQRLSDSLTTRHFVAQLYGALALMALLLAVAGTYSVTQFFLSQQRFEIALRMALGATRGDVRRRLVLGSLGPAVGGAFLGVVATSLVLPLLESQLFGVNGSGILTVIAAALVLIGVVFLACLLPSRRVAEIAPSHVLQSE